MPCSSDTQMTPDLQKAIFIAEQAVNESWRNSNLREETVQAFRQLIQVTFRKRLREFVLTYFC